MEIRRNIVEEINKNELTVEQQRLLDICEAYEYDITINKLSYELGRSYTTVQTEINRMYKKGYNIYRKMQQKQEEKKQKSEERKRQQIEARKEKRRQKQAIAIEERRIAKEKEGKQELTTEQQRLLDVLEEYNYDISYTKVCEITKKSRQAVNGIITTMVKKFSNSILDDKDAMRIAMFIINKQNVDKIVHQLQIARKINYNNIRILIDELLQDEKEDRTQGIEFVIEYEKILLRRGLERVEEPIYQLLVKHNVQLTKKQCIAISDLMDIYEQNIIKEKVKCKETKNSITLTSRELMNHEDGFAL